MIRILIAGDKAFTDDIENSYENRDIVAMLCGDGEMSLTYHTLDPLPSDWTEYDGVVISVDGANTQVGQDLLNDRTDKTPTMGHLLAKILICGPMDVEGFVNVESFDNSGEILRHIMEDML